MESFSLLVSLTVMVAVVGWLIGSLVRSVRAERRPGMGLWENFGLSLAFCALFFVSWAGQAVAEWQVYRQEQLDHGSPPVVSDFLNEFAQSTLENWQSEFLQLFSFTVMAALLIHRGSAESKDSDEEIKRSLARIEQRLGTRDPA